jgi:phosphoglycolate phosphatase
VPEPTVTDPTRTDAGTPADLTGWAVVFDLDGTLVDSSHDITRAVNAMLTGHGLPGLVPAQVEPLLGEGARSLVDAVYAILGVEVGPDRLTDDTATYLAHYAREPVKDSALYLDARPALDELRRRGVALGVCTNKNSDLAVRVLTELGVDHVCAAVLGGDALPVRKPDPQHLLATVTAIGAAPERTIFVGDSRIDAECGRRAGITSVLVDWGVPDARHPRIASFSALLGMIPDGHRTTAGLLDHASRKDRR